MKGIWNRIYLGLVILGILVPMQARAAQQDTVTLQQEEARVAVSVGISNAKEEKISTISVSLNVNVGGLSQSRVTFDFDSGLEGITEHDSIYNASMGRMDIYVTSLQNQSLFGDGELKLGYVRVEPLDTSQVLQVEVSYLEDSFQAANASYGSKKPVISSPPEPVALQVGAGVIYDTSASAPDNGSAGGGDDSGNDDQSTNNNAAGSSYGNDNMNQGLYDESTRFVNDPADAQMISSPVIGESNIHPELVDMSKGAAAAIGGKSLSGAAGSGGSEENQAGISGKVSVVSPKEGPDSILIAGSGGASADGLGISTSGGEGAAGAQEQDGTNEIRLDKKNGGVYLEKNSVSTKWIIAGAAFVAAVGIGILIFAMRKRKHAGRKKKKPAGRKKKRSVGKRKAGSAAKKEPVSGKKRKR